jgi:hypothetical protein
MIPLEVQAQLREALSERLTGRVKIDFFTQRSSALFLPGVEPCTSCDEAEALTEDLARLSPLVTLTVHTWGSDRAVEKRMGVERVPATVLRGSLNRPLLFYGLGLPPLFSAIINAVVYLSDNRVELPPAAERRLSRLRENVTLRVFVENGSDFCRQMLDTAFSFAVASKNVRVEGVEIGSFAAITERMGLTRVPYVTINEQTSFTGLVTPETLAEEIFRSVTRRAVGTERPETLGSSPVQAREAAQREEAFNVRPSGLIVPGR